VEVPPLPPTPIPSAIHQIAQFSVLKSPGAQRHLTLRAGEESLTQSTRPRIGVLAIQGDYAAHAEALSETGAEPVEIRKPEELANLDGLVLPAANPQPCSSF